MSQPKKREIADYFRPYARPIVPRKRPIPESDGDNETAAGQPGCLEKTLSTVHGSKPEAMPNRSKASSRPTVSPRVTPKSGRSISIPIRSPTPKRFLPKQHTSLFDFWNKSSSDSPQAAPSLSFADAPNLSRKVIEAGKLVEVRDSDESDNESLESLTDVFDPRPSTEAGFSASQPDSSAAQEEERIRLLNIYTGGRSIPIVNRERMRGLQRREKENKCDLTSLIDEDRREEDARERIAKIEAELDESTRELREAKQSELDRKLLAAVLQGDTEDVDPTNLSRLMNAVDRTEALSGEKSFSFFGSDGPKDLASLKRANRAFPASNIPGNMWQPGDTAGQERTYLSGLMTELASLGKLPDEVVRWTYDVGLTEPSESLRHVYLQCITAASSKWTRAGVTPEDVQEAFKMLGAESAALRDNGEIESRRRVKRKKQKPDFHGLLMTISMFHCICQDMDFATLSKLVSLVCRLCLDEDVMEHNRMMQAAESILQKLVDLPDPDSRHHVHERILFDLSANLKEPGLQARFMSHFVPTSPSAVRLRVKLAGRFLLGPDRAAKVFTSSGSTQILTSLLKHVTTSPSFQVRPSTDFRSLAASAFLLDVVVSLENLAPVKSKMNENEFNAQVDALANGIHDLFVSIADTGASHLRRTEAKDVLQALHHRLLFAVRTRTRRKRHIFDANDKDFHRGRIKDAEEARQEIEGRGFMQNFLRQIHASREETQENFQISNG